MMRTLLKPAHARGRFALNLPAFPILEGHLSYAIITQLGWQRGGCHGKIAGPNGFRLSLLGFEPELDYMTLVKESRGRRLFPASPDQSLFLQKAAGVVPHGGGKKTEVGSEEYKL